MDIKTRDIADTARFFSATLGWRFAVDDDDWRRATTITGGNLAPPVPGLPPRSTRQLSADGITIQVMAL
ncbi:VOC family protein [Solwaraspora sp. WMMB762]|uniref:VOC family protein n=1 Tax=Solwaraspora sp. WMMB762 TaxID=3404120 RepID=UPI003B946C13